ncbi:hypothetical protein [Demequina sp. NBRC 110054]|uniref:hypothetical protein n=1 Tax=Demequina sp. NBRC 110054 TaxID=1570343 RepID=UPI001178443C|nr:hypothetical protein [Demequina sp. NBRC 110054]
MALRMTRGAWIGVGAGAAVAVVGAGAIGWMLGASDEPAAQSSLGTESGSALAESSERASASPSASPTAPAQGSAAAEDATDRAAEPADEPVAAPARTDPNAALALEGYLPVDYPDALGVTDAVWDDVGAGWSVALLSSVAYPFDERFEQPPAVLYLVDPSEQYYEVGVLPERMWVDSRVVSWVEDDDFVRLTWAGGWESARYDLRTGATQSIVFTSYGADAFANMFVAADAEGNELWSAESANGTKLYRWDAQTKEWAASSLVDDYPDADAWWEDFFWRTQVSDDGEKVVLHESSDPGVLTGRFVAYDLPSDTAETFEVSALAGRDLATVLYGIDDGVMVLDWGTELVGYGLEIGGFVEVVAWDDGEMLDAAWDGRVGWGQPTDPEAAFWACNC